MKKWLALRTNKHPRLVELERVVGNFCTDIWKHPQGGRLLVIYGENGTGKTHCAKAVSRWIKNVGPSLQLIRRPNEVSYLMSQFWDWAELLNSLKEGSWWIVDECASVDVLILDDVGAGHDPSFVGVDKLCQVLSARQDKWTLLTTNIEPGAWETNFDRRITSRFFRNSEIVDLSGVPDYEAGKVEKS